MDSLFKLCCATIILNRIDFSNVPLDIKHKINHLNRVNVIAKFNVHDYDNARLYFKNVKIKEEDLFQHVKRFIDNRTNINQIYCPICKKTRDHQRCDDCNDEQCSRCFDGFECIKCYKLLCCDVIHWCEDCISEDICSECAIECNKCGDFHCRDHSCP